MKGKNAVEGRVDRLAMIKRVLDETEVAADCSRVKAKVGDWR